MSEFSQAFLKIKKRKKKMEFYAKMLEALKLTGMKVYIAGIGGICLGVYYITEGDVEKGVETVLIGFGAIGGRAAYQKSLDKG